MNADALTLLRAQLAAFVGETAGDLEPRELVAAFVEKHPETVAAASELLQAMALVKLVNDVSRYRLKVQRGGQLDLFYGFSIPRRILVDLDEGGFTRRRRRSPLDIPPALITAYLKRTPKVRRKTRDVGLEGAIARATPFLTSPSMTLGEGLAAADAAEQAEAAAS